MVSGAVYSVGLVAWRTVVPKQARELRAECRALGAGRGVYGARGHRAQGRRAEVWAKSGITIRQLWELVPLDFGVGLKVELSAMGPPGIVCGSALGTASCSLWSCRQGLPVGLEPRGRQEGESSVRTYDPRRGSPGRASLTLRAGRPVWRVARRPVACLPLALFLLRPSPATSVGIEGELVCRRGQNIDLGVRETSHKDGGGILFSASAARSITLVMSSDFFGSSVERWQSTAKGGSAAQSLNVAKAHYSIENREFLVLDGVQAKPGPLIVGLKVFDKLSKRFSGIASTFETDELL
ncbi:hypothetical protein Esti_002843 [Eimeria stiedai]